MAGRRKATGWRPMTSTWIFVPDCVGYFEHGTLFSSEIDVIASGAEDCRTRVERIPETSLHVRIGTASARKLL
jgi:hypothetical protein